MKMRAILIFGGILGVLAIAVAAVQAACPVATLLNENGSAGDHEVVWTGRDDAGRPVASGTYFYRIDAGPYSEVRKMNLMK